MAGAAWNVDGRGPDPAEVRAAVARLRAREDRAAVDGLCRVTGEPGTGRALRRWSRDIARARWAVGYARAFLAPCSCCEGPGPCFDVGPAMGPGYARRGARARALADVLRAAGRVVRRSRRRPGWTGWGRLPLLGALPGAAARAGLVSGLVAVHAGHGGDVCSWDGSTGCCSWCGVGLSGAFCSTCSGRGYHRAGCALAGS